MTIRKSSLNSPIPLPTRRIKGASDEALERGFSDVPSAENAEDPSVAPPVTEGFLPRSRGWDR